MGLGKMGWELGKYDAGVCCSVREPVQFLRILVL